MTSLQDAVSNANEALSLCLCNKFTEAENYLKPLDETCIYHMISKATISYLQAILTYEQEYIEKAYEKVKAASQLCDKARKKQTWSETFHNWVGRPYFDDFSEDELHAELCYAECLLERAMLTFIQDENLISFIKGGLKVRNAYNLYRNCMTALKQKPKQLQSSTNQVDFESGVYMGMGSFNVLLSLLPARVLRLLEWVGFSGDKETGTSQDVNVKNQKLGLSMLDKGFQLDGLRSPMCTITLLGYQIVISPLLGIGDTDVTYAQSILDVYLNKFPESSIFLYFSGRLKQTQCSLDEALELYEQSVSANIDWQQIHHICYWEMMWCYSFKGDWLKAAEFAEKLSTESRWSKSSYLYMHACFLIMEQFELKHGNIEQIKQADQYTKQIEQLLHDVSKYKQRIAGKSLPFEKFAVNRVEKYIATGYLMLPALEIIHLWNGFTMFSTHTETLQRFLNLTQTALDDLAVIQDSSKHHHDNIQICKLLQGICLRHLNRYSDAETILNQVAACSPVQHSSKMDCYLPPYASAELGFMYRSQDDSSKALHQLQHTIKHYSKYGLESRLHFRVHSSIETLKELLNKPELNNEEDGEQFYDVVEEPNERESVDIETEKSPAESSPLESHIESNAVDLTKSNGHTIVEESTIEITKNRVPSPCQNNNLKKTSSPAVKYQELTSSRTPSPTRSSERSPSHNKKSPRLNWFRKKRKNSKSDSPFHTPCASPDFSEISEASSDISPRHSYTRSPEQLRTNKITSL